MNWLALGGALALLGAWEGASATGLLRPVFFPRPSTIAVHWATLAADGTLAYHAGVTLARAGWVLALAAPPAVAVGFLMGMSRRTRQGLDPLFAVIYPIPSILFLPLVSFVLRHPEGAVVLTGAVTPFFLVAYTTLAGVQHLDRTVVEAAVHFGAVGWRLLRRVLLPGSLPFVLTGLRLGVGYALIVLVAVEMASAREGLGALLWLSWQLLKVEEMYAALVTIAAIGGLLAWALGGLRRWLLPWVVDVAEVGQ